ncbi:MAG: hypothetical protein AB1861_22025 [Cyanobacteriota bacterium]
MRIPTETRQRAIDLVDKLPQELLDEAVNFLESLSMKANQVREPASSKSEETALLEIIHRRLPAEDRTRLDYLRQKNETSKLTDAEHREILAYVEQVENQDVERAEALIKLAKIRKVDLSTLISEVTSEDKINNVV